MIPAFSRNTIPSRSTALVPAAPPRDPRTMSEQEFLGPGPGLRQHRQQQPLQQ